VRDLSDNTRAWKADEARPQPYITLYEVEVSDSVTLRFVQGDPLGLGKVTYGGNDYLACGIKDDPVEQTMGGDLPQYRVSIGNLNGVAGGVIEQNELDGRRVTIRRFVNLEGLGNAGVLAPSADDVHVETWTILSQGYDRKVATVSLGPPKFFQIKVPRRKYIRNRCPLDYGNRFVVGNPCHYPSDEFEADTAQDFKAGATADTELIRQFGWRTLNAAKLLAEGGWWNADQTNTGELYCETAGVDCSWDVDSRGAPFAYKEIDGDFDVSTETGLYATRDGMSAGLLVQATVDPTSWLFLVRSAGDSDEYVVRVASALAGVANANVVTTDASHQRLRRVGDVFTSYTSSDGVTWVQVDEQTLALLPVVRVGLLCAASDASPGQIAAGWPHFRFTAGGIATCDRTIEDCELHSNVHRHGAFPGIPTR